ncbi:hypothetical protein LYNGBM3L_67010 [Moorena producens 3L]|uniref:Uncharacterized protein n=1 Tax=Moorena producens 3L TaxID=489825 RepID=F4Y1V5_9CYAN|nr:hypothetical protein LYNGBM3L_67010 [Moorena producens 3L]
MLNREQGIGNREQWEVWEVWEVWGDGGVMSKSPRIGGFRGH